MDTETINEITEACEELGIEYEIYEGYSGRGMYGRTTTGVELTSSWDLQPLKDHFEEKAKESGEYDSDDYHRHYLPCSTDSLGLGVILY